MIYTQRTTCMMCKKEGLVPLLDKSYTIPLGNFVVDSPSSPSHFMPYSVVECRSCGTVQTEMVGDLDLIYGGNFAGAFGSIRSSHNQLLSEFILSNPDVQSVLEIGAGNGALSDMILRAKQIPYTILDPSYCGSTENRTLLRSYIDTTAVEDLSSTTVVMSHVFEHFYSPTDILAKLSSMPSLQYLYISLPDFEAYLEDGTYHVLNSEHTFCTTNQFLKELLQTFGFSCRRQHFHERHSVFFEFWRDPSCPPTPFPINRGLRETVLQFFGRLQTRIDVYRTSAPSLPVYLWPCSMHTLFALSLGLPQDRITGVLDNSPLKIGKFLYGYGYPCLSFQTILQEETDKVILLTGGCYTQEVLQTASLNPRNRVFIL